MNLRTLVIVVLLAATSLRAQQAQPEPTTRSAGNSATARQAADRAYRFEYTLSELDGKQKINTRKFEILTSDHGSVRASSRVAVPTSGTATAGAAVQYTYMDLGLNANMHFTTSSEGTIRLSVDVGMTFLVAADRANSGLGPTTRHIQMEIATELKPGVPTSIGTVEDVASTHAYELSVTAAPK